MVRKILITALFLSLAGCGGGEEGGGAPVTVAKGSNSGVASARMQVVYTEAEWATLWAEHSPGTPAPSVDFTKHMVVAAFNGPIQAIFRYEIVGSFVENGDLMIKVERDLLGAGCGSTTGPLLTPFHIVTLKRSDRSIGWDVFSQSITC